MKTDYRTYKLNKKESVVFLLGGYLIIFAVLYLFYHNYLFSLVGGMSAVFFSPFYANYLNGKRNSILLIQFKDVLYALTASIASGRHMADAIPEAIEQLKLIYGESGPMVEELKIIEKGINLNKESDIDLLRDFAERSGCEDIRNFVQVYGTCRTMGGNLEKVLKNTTEILVDKMNIQREMKTLTAQKKLEGKIISLMPMGVILFLNLMSPDYMEPLYDNAGGRLIMTIALLGITASWYWTAKLTELEV